MAATSGPVRVTLLILCIAGALLAGCGGIGRSGPPVLATPEQALDYYLQSLRAGDLAGVMRVTHPPADDFYVPGPIKIERYDIILREVIDGAAAARYDFVPPPQAGDVRIDIIRTDGRGIQDRFSYYFRKIDTSWKLYAWSGWGTDDFLD